MPCLLTKKTMLKNIFYRLIKHRPEKRGDQVIYLLLLIFLIIAFFCFSIVLASNLIGHGGSVILSLTFVLLIISAIYAFQAGYIKIVNYFFLFLILFGYYNIVHNSGVENLFAILLMVFYIIISAIMFKSRSFLVSILVLFFIFITQSRLEIKGLVSPDLSWRASTTTISDIAAISVILSLIIFISWLFNREINSYIYQLEESQKLLRKERDLLEMRVKERTKQLQREQLDRLSELSKFAEFGRLAQGLFHDLTNPLTALSLNLDQLKKEKDSSKAKLYIKETNLAAENMKNLIDSTMIYSQNKLTKESFSIVEELKNAQLICNYKSRQAGVDLKFQDQNDIKLFGNRTRFSQLICNIILNAVEAYEEQKSKIKEDDTKEITINFSKVRNDVIISIKDNALGIPDRIKENIFKPFYSTKQHLSNSGIGLSMCKDIVESDFMGKIKLNSQLSKGSEFVITVPLVLQKKD